MSVCGTEKERKCKIKKKNDGAVVLNEHLWCMCVMNISHAIARREKKNQRTDGRHVMNISKLHRLMKCEYIR